MKIVIPMIPELVPFVGTDPLLGAGLGLLMTRRLATGLRRRQEGLKLPRWQCKRLRLGQSDKGMQRMAAERINRLWSYRIKLRPIGGSSGCRSAAGSTRNWWCWKSSDE